MSNEPELRQWLRQMADRDEAALASFYRALSGTVFAFVQRRLDHPQDAEAVVVDTLHEAWKKASTFSGRSQVKTWVLGIARHKLLDVLRQRGARLEQDDVADHVDALVDDSADPFLDLAQRQQQAWVAFCMDKLPPDQRDSLHLLFFEGLSVDDIAQVLACPGNTVKTRVFHAKRKIKSCLSNWLRASGQEGFDG